MHRFCVFLNNKQLDKLKELSQITENTMAEWLRDMINFCSQEHVLNQLKPTFSGQIHLGR